MNKIYMLGGSRGYPEDLLTESFATDEEGLKRIVLHYCQLDYDRIIVDMAAEVVRIMCDGDVVCKYHIWTVTRSI